ncbi:MAG: dipeptidase [Lachnospiraceae bacterium]|uniref:dipeptidase n=1 Tax=Parablautia sp. Marseille-Q6255 TaxID=3039593 RepID=UPI0024BBF656|nr:dipeptidase [Parablautia sp. Marseille-Q6255]
MNYIDMHCDTLSEAFLRGRKDIFDFPEAMVDVKRLKKAGAAAQFFAIYMMPQTGESLRDAKPERDERSSRKSRDSAIPDDDLYIEALCKIMEDTVREHPELIAVTRSAEELEDNLAGKRISAFLTLEDGRAVQGSMDRLEDFYKMGIRLISLTWNFANCFGSPNSTDRTVMEQGLTAFGKEAVSRMEELGMIVDVSHLSDGGFLDVAQVLHGPFVASHSNCRALSPHPRNLTDDMLRTLGERGGVAGLNFFPAFLHRDETREDSTVRHMAAHIKHMVNKGGIECAAIGTDFDGIHGQLEIGEPQKMHLLFERLEQEGFTTGEIEKIAFGNVRRVIHSLL